MANILEVTDLCKTYITNKRQNNVLRNVNFSVDEGEMVAVMGPSGSGKSTLLYTVSGMDNMTAGKVLFGGKDISALKPTELASLRLDEMGFIFQQMYMLKNLSVLDNIILPARQSKNNMLSAKEKLERGKELMRRLGIIEIADNDINEVSGGQLQRACICRSMINNPKMIFADEPTGALNRQSSNEVMEELCKINADGTTIMLVTHDAKIAAKCSRVLYIVDGNIQGEYNNTELEERKRERALMIDILVVEDNLEMATLLCDFLKAEGYSVQNCTDGESALKAFESEDARLVILDIMLPGLDGFAVCRKIRENANTPIIIVSAKTEKDDKLNGLILGADDYIEKPYDIDILLAKIKGIFTRRYQTEVLSDGFLKIDKSKRIAYKEKIPLDLTQKEFDLLLLLMENTGKTLSKDYLFNQIWGFDSFSEPQTLTVHIKWLRQKIESNPKNPDHIVTVWGVGYRYER